MRRSGYGISPSTYEDALYICWTRPGKHGHFDVACNHQLGDDYQRFSIYRWGTAPKQANRNAIHLRNVTTLRNTNVNRFYGSSPTSGFASLCARFCLGWSAACLALLWAIYTALVNGKHLEIGLTSPDDVLAAKENCLTAIWMYVTITIAAITFLLRNPARPQCTRRKPDHMPDLDYRQRSRTRTICVEGNIGSGKSTLLEGLSR